MVADTLPRERRPRAQLPEAIATSTRLQCRNPGKASVRDTQHERSTRSRAITRRHLLKASAAALGTIPLAVQAAAAQTPATADLTGSSLRILQWNHVIPGYDRWFTQFATAWGQQHGVTVTVDLVDSSTIPHAMQTEFATGTGHDLIEHIAPLPMFASSLVDLSDLVAEAARRHGDQQEFCRQDSLNPESGRFYGFAHGYAPTAINYRPSLWQAVNLPGGPATWYDLVRGGSRIWSEQGIALGFGLSDELDSNTSILAALWAHGASVQDKDGRIALNSPQTVQVVKLFTQLYRTAMTPAVFGWDILGNNQLLIDGQASAILNALSAFRTIQQRNQDLAKDLMLRAPLQGPTGTGSALAPAHVRFISMIPAFSPNRDAAQEFLLALVGSYAQVTDASGTYNFPAFPSTVPALKANGGPLDYNPSQPDQGTRLTTLKDANSWTTNLGWPGPTTVLSAAAVNESILSQMVARAARGELSAEDAVREAEARLNTLTARG